MTESDATRDYLIYAVEVLRLYFQSRRHIYVSGNLFVYYEEGNTQAVVSPDVFVIFGVPARQRRSYQAWKEGGKLPSFILEITSRTTKRQDEQDKPKLYARLGVEEYFQYDPTADYLNPQLKGSRLQNGQYQPLPLVQSPQGLFIHSQVLGLDLRLQEAATEAGIVLPKALRFYDPQTGVQLLTRQEVEQERDRLQQERDAVQRRTEQLAARLRQLGIDPDAEG